MIEQIRGEGGDDMHFLSGGTRLDPAERLPIYLSDFELDEACDQCGDRHRPDFAGDCRNDYQSFTEMDPHWREYGIEPDYVCRGGHEWVNRVTLGAALAADAVTTNAPPKARRAAAREYLLDVRHERGYPVPDDTHSR